MQAKFGPESARSLTAAFSSANRKLVDGRAPDAIGSVRSVLQRDASYKGVVLLGGYDVLPSQILNTLPPQLAGEKIADRDRLQVWSDDAYGDLDGDGVPELPVSRVPDGGSMEFLRFLLNPHSQGARSLRAGVRNRERPFADGIFSMLPGASPMFTSASAVPGIPPYPLNGDMLYLMLHGTAHDGTVFQGESDDDYPVAVIPSTIPKPCPSLVFTGCCYGALLVDEIARDAQPGQKLTPRSVKDSIALTCLSNGANAFLGCTGTHYSPLKPPLVYFGQPFHRLFWRHYLNGEPPARALWMTKIDYAKGIPHRPSAKPADIAYEHKIMRQYTCLGLGW